MIKLSKFGLGLIFLVGALIVAFTLNKLKPQAVKEAPEVIKPLVEALVLEATSHKVIIPSQGVIEPITQTMAASEVAGRVIWVSEKFEAGERFTAGPTPEESDLLLRIDPTDYKAALAQAKATHAEAELALETELARQAQSKRDWQKLKSGGTPGPLVLREPHVKAARERVAAAAAAVAKAEADLARTELRAPYNGRIRSTATDLGSYTTPGAPLAELYRTDMLEIRLPVSLDEYAFIDNPNGDERAPTVDLHVEVAGRSYDWSAKVVRTEGQVDRSSRSVYLVARVDTQQLSEEFANPEIDLLAPGLFVKARVHGKTFDNIFRVPRKALYTPDTVVLIDDKDQLYFRKVKILRSEGAHILVRSGDGLNPGERVCQTALDTVIEGMPVEVRKAHTDSSQITESGLAPTESERP